MKTSDGQKQRDYSMYTFIIVFAFAASASIAGWTLSWEIIVLVVLALTPVSIKEIEWTKDGGHILTKNFGGEIDTVKANLTRSIQDERAESHPSTSACKVLRTLKYYQNERFPTDDNKRWGFRIGSVAQDYPFFLAGISELTNLKLIITDPNGLVGLSPDGLAFVRKNANEKWMNGDMWSDFYPA